MRRLSIFSFLVVAIPLCAQVNGIFNGRSPKSTILCIIRGGETNEVGGELINENTDDSSDAENYNKFEDYMGQIQQRTQKAKELFIDKISLVSTALIKSEHDAAVENVTEHSNSLLDEVEIGDDNDDEITLQSDLMRPNRSITIVTTAAIPWFTGTSVNPLLRAAYLNRMVKKINAEAGEEAKQRITLVIPWLEMEEDRRELYGNKHNFTTPEDQEDYIRNWLRNEADMPDEADSKSGIKIVFYPSRYHSGLKSIFAMGDILSVISEEMDICILEEPEHLNWYRSPGDGWTKRFRYVIGIIHTNYLDYASSHYSGLWTAPAIKIMSSAMVRAYCHIVVKLSDTLQTFAEEKERTSNVHGVRLDFLKEGDRRAAEYHNNTKNINQETNITASEGLTCDSKSSPTSSKKNLDVQIYFVGKLLWAKGLGKMLELENYYKSCTGNYFPIDIYGNGPEEKEIRRAFHGRSKVSNFKKDSSSRKAKKSTNHSLRNDTIKEETFNSTRLASKISRISKHLKATTETIKITTDNIEIDFPRSLHELRKDVIPSSFPGRVDHASLTQYKIFVNPSKSEVLCTTTAEALAMGKFVIIPDHPSNTFFLQFENCLPYRTKMEFAANLHWALNRDPAPLKPEQKRLLTWEAATERLVSASAITRREAKERHRLGMSKVDERIAWFHNELGKGVKGDTIRKVLGGGPIANQHAYEQSKDGLFEISDDDDEGLSAKFVRSSLAEAIRDTLTSAVPNIMASISP